MKSHDSLHARVVFGIHGCLQGQKARHTAPIDRLPDVSLADACLCNAKLMKAAIIGVVVVAAIIAIVFFATKS